MILSQLEYSSRSTPSHNLELYFQEKNETAQNFYELLVTVGIAEGREGWK